MSSALLARLDRACKGEEHGSTERFKAVRQSGGLLFCTWSSLDPTPLLWLRVSSCLAPQGFDGGCRGLMLHLQFRTSTKSVFFCRFALLLAQNSGKTEKCANSVMCRANWVCIPLAVAECPQWFIMELELHICASFFHHLGFEGAFAL